jgi:hypothetical protein
MENLLKIKLDPLRGGSSHFDFIRPNFIVNNWPGDGIVLEYSNNGGATWVSLIPDVHYRSCYDATSRQLYVSLLFNIETELLIAFNYFEEVEPELCSFPLGWANEGISCSIAPLGWDAGADEISSVQAGYAIYGCYGIAITVGWVIKWFENINTQVGWTVADPVDAPITIGFDIGTIDVGSIRAGTTILGIANYPGQFIVLDRPSIDALGSSAVRCREKTITLSGYDPEVLD